MPVKVAMKDVSIVFATPFTRLFCFRLDGSDIRWILIGCSPFPRVSCNQDVGKKKNLAKALHVLDYADIALSPRNNCN